MVVAALNVFAGRRPFACTEPRRAGEIGSDRCPSPFTTEQRIRLDVMGGGRRYNNVIFSKSYFKRSPFLDGCRPPVTVFEKRGKNYVHFSNTVRMKHTLARTVIVFFYKTMFLPESVFRYVRTQTTNFFYPKIVQNKFCSSAVFLVRKPVPLRSRARNTGRVVSGRRRLSK